MSVGVWFEFIIEYWQNRKGQHLIYFVYWVRCVLLAQDFNRIRSLSCIKSISLATLCQISSVSQFSNFWKLNKLLFAGLDQLKSVSSTLKKTKTTSEQVSYFKLFFFFRFIWHLSPLFVYIHVSVGQYTNIFPILASVKIFAERFEKHNPKGKSVISFCNENLFDKRSSICTRIVFLSVLRSEQETECDTQYTGVV